MFFDDVRVPVENLVGQENKGWDYAKFLLGNERTGIARVGVSKERIRRIKELAAIERAGDTPLIEDRALPREARRRRGRAEGAGDDPAARRRRRAPARATASPTRPPRSSRSRDRRSSRRRPSCCMEVVGPYALPYQPDTRTTSAGTSRRSVPIGPATSRRPISTGARSRSMAARTRSRRTSSPRRSWASDQS